LKFREVMYLAQLTQPMRSRFPAYM